MSNNPFQQNQDPYGQPQGNPYHQPNPWQDQPSSQQQQHQHQQQQPPYGQAQQYQQQQQYPTQQQHHGDSGYTATPGPPPSRTKPFEAADFVPAGELSQQRELMEQFESDHQHGAGTGGGAGGGESQTDRDVATLQAEFPGIDGSVVAAIYGDSGDMGATREVLQELSAGGAAGEGR